MGKFTDNIKDILKSVGDFVCSLFGFDKENGVGDSINDLAGTLTGSPIFMTEKEKAKQEQENKKAIQERNARCWEESAKNMGEMAESIKELTEIIKNK